jgi:hypothetical protein
MPLYVIVTSVISEIVICNNTTEPVWGTSEVAACACPFLVPVARASKGKVKQ